MEIPIITHTAFDLSKLDFSFKDIYLYEIKSDEFKEYIRSFHPPTFEDNFDFFKEIISNIHHEYEKFYAVIKKDFRSNFNQQDILNVYTLLLIICPSDIQVLHSISFAENGGFIQPLGMSSWDERYTGEYPGKYLLLLDESVPEVNEFIRVVFDRLSAINYIGICIFHYINSFNASHSHFQYIALCMVLESIICGNSELTYRLKRNTALLLGENAYGCKKCFKNLDKIYSLRSKIVHGKKYNNENIISYLPYIQALSSRVIIELLLHSKPTTNSI